MKKLYIIRSSWGNSVDSYKLNECVCSNPFIAEIKRKELENEYKKELPFPFDYCTEKEVDDLFRQGKILYQEAEIYLGWLDKKDNLKEFNGCIIEEIDYYE